MPSAAWLSLFGPLAQSFGLSSEGTLVLFGFLFAVFMAIVAGIFFRENEHVGHLAIFVFIGTMAFEAVADMISWYVFVIPAALALIVYVGGRHQ